MRGDVLRGLVCWIVLILHAATIFASPYFIVDFSDAIEVILILMPLTGLYVGVVVNFYSSFRQKEDSEIFSVQFASITIFLVSAFSIGVIGIQYLYFDGVIETLEELKRAVGIVDTGLGIYTGFLVKALFQAR